MARRKKTSSLWDIFGILFLFDLFSPNKKRKNNNEASIEDVFLLFFGIFYIVFGILYIFVKMIEWTIKGIILIFIGIGNLINHVSNNSSKSKKRNYSNSVSNYTPIINQNNSSSLLPKSLTNNNINYKEPIKYENKKLMLPKYKISTPYDALFTGIIMERGIDYFNSKKVINYKLEEQVCTADVIGTEDYKTRIVFYKNGKIKKGECTCPYFAKDNVYCKHIYALLLNYCENEHIDGFINEIFYEEESKSIPNYKVDNAYNKMNAICDAMTEIINNSQEYYDELENTEKIEDTYTEIMEYEEKINIYQNSKITDINQLLINSAQNDLDDMRSLYDELEMESEEIEDEDDSSDDAYEFNEALAAGFVAHEMHKDYLRRKEEDDYYNDDIY